MVVVFLKCISVIRLATCYLYIASNLRYYLTFILYEIIDYVQSNHSSIENYFVFNEIEIGNIKFNGNKLSDIFKINCSLDFIN